MAQPTSLSPILMWASSRGRVRARAVSTPSATDRGRSNRAMKVACLTSAAGCMSGVGSGWGRSLRATMSASPMPVSAENARAVLSSRDGWSCGIGVEEMVVIVMSS